MRRSILLALLVIAPAFGPGPAFTPARAFAQSDADDAARLRGEILALRRELQNVKARLAHVEQQLANVATVASQDVVTPKLDPALGFVVPGLPRTPYGAVDPHELARLLLHYAANAGEHDVEQLVAFRGDEFMVLESLWSQAARGLKTVQGLPTRDEFNVAYGALKTAGPGAQLLGTPPVQDLGCLRVVDMTVSSEGRTLQFRLTAAKLGGRWCAAHLLVLTAEEEARGFLEDLIVSQATFYSFHHRFAKNLHELYAERDLENNPSVKYAHLSFPIASRFDRIEKGKLAAWNGNDLVGPFYRFTLNGDGKTGWSAKAIPSSASYYTFSVSAPVGSPLGAEVKKYRASSTGEPLPESPGEKREGEQE
jgi:hypothetical protein